MNKKNTLLFYVFLFLIAFVSFGNRSQPIEPSHPSEKLNTTASNNIEDLITAEEWLTYFPYRWGYDIITKKRTEDFYTYEKFKEALENISKYELLIERRCGTNQVKITHTNNLHISKRSVIFSHALCYSVQQIEYFPRHHRHFVNNKYLCLLPSTFYIWIACVYIIYYFIIGFVCTFYTTPRMYGARSTIQQ